MSSLNRFFASRWGPIAAGAFIGIVAPLLVNLGNPGNMGVCVACFSRDIAGALGLQRVATVQYIRPEIIGMVLGALVAALAFREFKPRTGSSPLIRFVLGVFAAIGTLVFLGCTWRAFLRLGGGDWNALFGILGMIVGIAAGIFFLRKGFSLGRNHTAPDALGWTMPALMVGLLTLLVVAPLFTKDANGNPAGPIFFSTSGPGSQHAPLLISLVVGLLIGLIAQRSRFCTVGGLRDLMLMRDTHLFYGIVALVLAAFATNLLLGQFNPGFDKQPIAHTDELWNFGGMVLAGLAFTLGGGCPGRQLILSGEGDGDAGIFVLGMITGAAFAHNFNLASSTAGPSAFGPAAVIFGLVICVLIGFVFREPQTA
jgi:YedE family putative selenium metabolism protein